MGLQIPVVGDAGTGYATNISNALSTLDSHNHTSGKGVLVPTAGLNINADLAFGGFQATGLLSTVFNQLANTTTNLTNQAFTNVLGRPYWRDNSGTIKQVTLAGDALTALSSLTLTAIAAPGTPGAGTGTLYEDSTSLNLAFKNASGVVNHGVQTKAAVAHQWLASIANDGSSVLSQPAFGDISGAASLTTQVTGTLPIGNGGTGQTTAPLGFDALANSSWTIAAVNGTTDLSTVAGISGTVTGSGSFTTTGLGTAPAGTRRFCKVGAGLSWVLSNGAAIVIPGGNSIAMAAGDSIEFSSLGSGNWQVVAINNAAAGLVVGGSGTFISNGGVATCYFNTTAMQPQVIVRAVSGSVGAPEYGFSSDPGSDSGFYYTGTDNQIGWSAGGVKQLLVDTNGLQHATRHQLVQGATVASAATITLGNDGNVFPISGTTVINSITNTGWQTGSVIYLKFLTGVVSQVTVAGNIRPRTGAVQTTTPVGGAATLYVMQLVFDGTNWNQPG
jgi:hypothetical protein